MIDTPVYTTWTSTIVEHDSSTNQMSAKERPKSRIRESHNNGIILISFDRFQ